MHTDGPGATTPEQVDRPDAPQHDEPYLFVILECARPLAGGARFGLGGIDRVVLGRGTERRTVHRDGRVMELRLPGPLLSGTHATLTRDDDRWIIEDAGSRNGTTVNGRPIGRVELRDGDLIELGHILLRFRVLRVGTDRQSITDLDGPATSGPAGFSTLLPALGLELVELARLAASTLPILLLGETGTGKELIARGLHELSARGGEFIAVNCGALSGTLLDSQLFGHVRGSFTGAMRDEPGFVRASDGGTLFLDEIGDLPAAAQAALLRVLQEREVVPVGTTKPVKVDLRIIAATHRQLDLMSARGDFRSDLYARLSGHVHYLTPLRDRREDLGVIVAELLRRDPSASAPGLRFTAEAGRELVANSWQLNIRQLEQSLARALTLAQAGAIGVRQLFANAGRVTPAEAQPVVRQPPPREREREKDADDVEREKTLRELLERHRGNISEVARLMGYSRVQIHRWLQRYGLDIGAFRG